MPEVVYNRKRKGRAVNNSSDVWSNEFKLKLEFMATEEEIKQKERIKILAIVELINFDEDENEESKYIYGEGVLRKIERLINRPVSFYVGEGWGRQKMDWDEFYSIYQLTKDL